MKAGVQGRARASQLVASDLEIALEVADAIEHPWYRCQALTAVAAKLPDAPRALSVLKRALKAAHELREPNRVVTVASWPLRALVARGLDPTGEVERLLSLIETEPHTLRRADALFALLEGVFANVMLRRRVLGALLASLSVSHGWRSERLWGFTVLLMAGESPESAHDVLARMPECKAKRRAERELASPPYVGPRWVEYHRGEAAEPASAWVRQ